MLAKIKKLSLFGACWPALVSVFSLAAQTNQPLPNQPLNINQFITRDPLVIKEPLSPEVMSNLMARRHTPPPALKVSSAFLPAPLAIGEKIPPMGAGGLFPTTNGGPASLLAKKIADIRHELQDVTLEPHRRELLEFQLKSYLADLQLENSRKMMVGSLPADGGHRAQMASNIQLWNNLFQATKANDPKQIAETKQALANLLAKRLEEVQGKKYPSNASYAEITKEFHKQFGKNKTSKSSKVVSAGLLVLMPIPLIFFIIYWFRRKNTLPNPTSS